MVISNHQVASVFQPVDVEENRRAGGGRREGGRIIGLPFLGEL